MPTISRSISCYHFRNITEGMLETFNIHIWCIYQIGIDIIRILLLVIIIDNLWDSHITKANYHTMHVGFQRSLAIPTERAMCKVYMNTKHFF